MLPLQRCVLTLGLVLLVRKLQRNEENRSRIRRREQRMKRAIKAEMTQEFIVVRCFSCEVFQSHIARKDRKFGCKMCGVKQSVRKEYRRGAARNCRLHVQRLNDIRRGIKEKKDAVLEAQMEGQAQEMECKLEDERKGQVKLPVPVEGSEESSSGSVSSKWSVYLDSDSTSDSESE